MSNYIIMAVLVLFIAWAASSGVDRSLDQQQVQNEEWVK
jgi:hypothetical protein